MPPKKNAPVDLITEVPTHLEKVLATLTELQRRLDEEMSTGLASSKGAGINPQHVRLAMQLSTATSNLSREVRSWTRRVKELAGSASQEERLDAVRLFLESLPEVTRKKFFKDLNERN